MKVSDVPQIASLSLAEKISFVDDLWTSIAQDAVNLPVPEGHKAELNRRLEQITDNPDCLITLEELKKRIERWQ